MPDDLASTNASRAYSMAATSIAVGLVVVGGVWLVLWLVYAVFALRNFPTLRTPGKTS